MSAALTSLALATAFAVITCREARAQEGPLLIVPNAGTSDLTVFTLNASGGLSLTSTIAGVGNNPDQVAIRGDQAFAYATINATNSLIVIDTKTNAVVQTVTTGTGPRGVAVSPDGTRVYVANNNAGNTVSAFATNPVSGQLTALATITTGINPRRLVFSPDGSRLFIANQGGSVAILDTTTNTVLTTISTGGQLTDIAVNPAGTRLYVTSTTNQVFVIDTTTQNLVTTVPTGGDARGVIVSADGTRFYVTNQNTNSISQFDATTNASLGTVATGTTPFGIVRSPDGGFVYVANNNSDNVSIYAVGAGGLLTSLGTIASGNQPIHPGICGNGNAMLATGRTFVANTAGALGCTMTGVGTGPVFSGGTMQIAGSNVSSALPVFLAPAGGTVDTLANSATFSGNISGPGSLTKIGNGALILTGANTYTGGTTISAGTLQIGTSGTQGALAGAVTVAALPATLSIVNADVSGITSILNNGLTEFSTGTTAGSIAITNNRTLDFSGGASAGNASITTGPESLTRFFDTSTAGNASIVNNDFVQLTETATTGAATVTNNATFVFFHSSTAGTARFINTGQLIFQASSSAAGAVIDNTGGEVFFTGNSTAANATINNAAAGSIAFFDSASGGSAAVTSNGLFAISGLAGAGTTVGSIGGGGEISLGVKNLSFGSLNTDTEISGVIFGDGGSLTKLGTGTTILSGDNEYTGTTTISQGVLQIGNGGATGSVAGNIVNNSVLSVNRSGAFDYAGVISGTGVLNHIGTGTTTLLGHNTYTGTTTVDAGTLLVNGTVVGPLAVHDGGRLGGNGTVGTTTVLSGGTIAPGNSIGTLHVAGNATVAAGSTYEVEIDAAGQSDLLAATGSVTLGGGEVVVLHAPGSYAAGTTYTIVTAAGGVSGAFDGVTDSLPLLDAVLSYLPVGVLLTLEENAQLIAALGITPNQRATGAGIDSLGGGALETALSSLGIGDIPPALDLLSGEIHASIKSALIEESRYLREAASNRIRLAFDAVGAQKLPVSGYDEAGPIAAEADTPLAMWGEVLGAWGSFDGDGNAAELDRSIGGFFTGIDALVADDMRLGLIGGYTHSSFDVDDRASSGSANAAHLGAYGGGQVGNLGVRAVAAYSWNFVDTSRTVAFDGFAESLDADYDAGTAQLFGEVGYRIDKASASFEPFANVAYVNLHTDSFAESGGAAALTQASGNTDQTFTTLGLRAATPFQLGGRSTTLSGMLGWRHAFDDVTPDAAFSFVGGAPFVIAGTPIARDALALEAGLDVQLGTHSSLGIVYSGQIGDGAQDHSANARLTLSF